MSKKKEADEKRRVFVDCGYDESGKRIRKSKICQSAAEEKRWREQITTSKKDIDMANYDITFEELGKKFRKHKKARDLATATLIKYDSADDVISRYPSIYKKKAREIKMVDLEDDIFIPLAKCYTKNYLQVVKGYISAVFNFGIDNDMILRNPCTRAKIPKKTAGNPRTAKKCWTPQELKEIEKHYNITSFGEVVYTMLNTGCRPQEVAAIDKDTPILIDGKPWLKIDKAMKRAESGSWVVGEPKTDSSFRKQPISNEVYFIVLKRVRSNKNGLFISGKGGAPISYTTFLNLYNDFFKALNKVSDIPVDRLTPHCCRHTYASRLEWNGISSSVRSELMGHASEEQTSKYTHSNEEELLDAISKIS